MAQNSFLPTAINLAAANRLELKLSRIRRRLLRWFKSEGRTFLWRRTLDPYQVLISEVLLKKTTAPVVDRYLPEFFLRYPDIKTLASAKKRSLKAFLQPLGLSEQRADQLIALSRVLKRDFDCEIPETLEALLALPGIGEYTANSILCVAFGEAVPVVDTNVARILVRLFSFHPSRFEARRSPEVWFMAGILVGRRGDVAKRTNWSLLDLGALICKARQPECKICPLLKVCEFAQSFSTKSECRAGWEIIKNS
jgi:A/G-specific adenine glycosylase